MRPASGRSPASERGDAGRLPPRASPGHGSGAEPDLERRAPARPRRRSGGVSVVAGGLLQDLEDRLRRDLAPIEERVRPGSETRGVAAGPGTLADDPVVVLPAARPDADAR